MLTTYSSWKTRLMRMMMLPHFFAPPNVLSDPTRHCRVIVWRSRRFLSLICEKITGKKSITKRFVFYLLFLEELQYRIEFDMSVSTVRRISFWPWIVKTTFTSTPSRKTSPSAEKSFTFPTSPSTRSTGPVKTRKGREGRWCVDC